MSLRIKIFASLFVVLVLSVVLHYLAFYGLVRQSFSDIEVSLADRDIERCLAAMDREIFYLSVLNGDWAAWDETYQFIRDKNQEYVQSTLNSETLKRNKINLIQYYDSANKLVWGKILDLKTLEPIEFCQFPKDGVPNEWRLLVHQSVASKVTGVVSTTKGPMMISSRPIVTSDNKGPIRGTLIMGRFLTRPMVKTISKMVLVNFRLYPFVDGEVDPAIKSLFDGISPMRKVELVELGEEDLKAYTILEDISGRPAALIEADIPRDVSVAGSATNRYASLFILAAGLIIMLFTIWLLRMLVIFPVTDLTKQILASRKSPRRTKSPLLNRSDEIGTLYKEFEGMMGQLTGAQQRLLEVSDMAIGALHNIGNAVNPALVRIEKLRSSLSQLNIGNIKRAVDELSEGNTEPDREKDLYQYMQMFCQRLSNMMDDWREQFAYIAGQISHIEQILDSQEKITRTNRPSERVFVSEVINDALAMTSDRLKSGVFIDIDDEMDNLRPVIADRFRFVLVVSNLLINGLESIHQAEYNPKVMRIHAMTEHENGREVIHLTICDSGVGIAAEKLHRPFEKGYSTKKDGRQGRGIGLHWCANTLTNMKGRIYFTSEGVKKGACVHVHLPTEG